MFKKFFKKVYKSRKTIPKELALKLKNDISLLEEDTLKRQAQVEKFLDLCKTDPEHKERYLRRIGVHKEFIKSNAAKIEEIEMILLDS